MIRSDFNEIIALAGQLQPVQKEAADRTFIVYGSEVNALFRLQITDKQRIEHTLDRLLDVAFDNRVLKLFKQLCRHYYFIDPQAAAFYVQSYREMWDNENPGQYKQPLGK